MGLRIFLLIVGLLVPFTLGQFPRLQIPKQAFRDYNAIAQAELRKTLKVEKNWRTAKNVILFIGDGMGVSTHTAARIYKGQVQGILGEEQDLAWEKFPHTGLIKTYCHSNQVPDSASTATAFLCGEKSNFATIGLNQNGVLMNCNASVGTQLTCIPRWSTNEGKSAGVITNTAITHATPAAAYANSPFRLWESDADIPPTDKACPDIAKQLVENGHHLQVILGGGRRKFLPRGFPDPEDPKESGTRMDGRNLIQEWQDVKRRRGQKYRYVWNQRQFDNVDPDDVDYLMGLFAPYNMSYAVDRRRDKAGEPPLKDMVTKAIRVLSKNPNGYFLLVEGGRIDHAHHQGKAHKAILETLALENAVDAAARITSEEDTLIVVSADHSHTMSIGGYAYKGTDILGKPSGLAVQFIAPSTDRLPYTTLMYGTGPGAPRGQGRKNLTGVNTRDPDFIQQAAIPMSSGTHSGEDVPIYARGPMAHLFSGVHEQHYIAHAMAYASCVGPNRGHCTRRSPAPRISALKQGKDEVKSTATSNNGVLFIVWGFSVMITVLCN